MGMKGQTKNNKSTTVYMIYEVCSKLSVTLIIFLCVEQNEI